VFYFVVTICKAYFSCTSYVYILNYKFNNMNDVSTVFWRHHELVGSSREIWLVGSGWVIVNRPVNVSAYRLDTETCLCGHLSDETKF